MKRRIAILTFQNTINYGATLQAFALQEYINKQNCNVEIINYENDILSREHKTQKFFQRRTFKQWVLYFLISQSINRKANAFRKFRLRYMTESTERYDINTIIQSNGTYDIYIVGSDQVWNGDITHNDMTYFLDFAEEGKVLSSYAASFGKEAIPIELHETYKKLLARFSFISVREQQGAQIIQSLINRPVEVVLDPIFLLSKTDWESIAVSPRSISKKYIVLYVFGRPSNLFKVARVIAKETGCKIVVIGSDYRKQIGFYYTGSVGPEQFLGYLLNASCVLTNSFHGTAFSINFNKQFYVELLPSSSTMNSRLMNILDTFKLQDRRLSSGIIPNSHELINYDKVNKILNTERIKSYAFLEKIINPEKEKEFGTNQ
jgi:hypothetical protein